MDTALLSDVECKECDWTMTYPDVKEPFVHACTGSMGGVSESTTTLLELELFEVMSPWAAFCDVKS